MRVFKVIKPKKEEAKKTGGSRVVHMTKDPAARKPYIVQIFRNGLVVQKETFINKSAAKEWADLNASGVEFKDLTGPNTVTPRDYSK